MKEMNIKRFSENDIPLGLVRPAAQKTAPDPHATMLISKKMIGVSVPFFMVL